MSNARVSIKSSKQSTESGTGELSEHLKEMNDPAKKILTS